MPEKWNRITVLYAVTIQNFVMWFKYEAINFHVRQTLVYNIRVTSKPSGNRAVRFLFEKSMNIATIVRTLKFVLVTEISWKEKWRGWSNPTWFFYLWYWNYTLVGSIFSYWNGVGNWGVTRESGVVIFDVEGEITGLLRGTMETKAEITVGHLARHFVFLSCLV